MSTATSFLSLFSPSSSRLFTLPLETNTIQELSKPKQPYRIRRDEDEALSSLLLLFFILFIFLGFEMNRQSAERYIHTGETHSHRRTDIEIGIDRCAVCFCVSTLWQRSVLPTDTFPTEEPAGHPRPDLTSCVCKWACVFTGWSSHGKCVRK